MDIFLSIISSFSFQIIIIELMFCFFLEKRNYFYLRLIPSIILFVGTTFDLPFYSLFNIIPIRFILTFAFSILVLIFCFKNIKAVLFCSLASFFVRVFAQNVYIFLIYFWPSSFSHEKYDFRYYLTFIICYILLFFIFATRFKKKQNLYINNIKLFPLLFVVILINEMLGLFLYQYKMSNNPIISIYGILCSILSLLLQFQFFKEKEMDEENILYKKLLKESKEQFSISKYNMDLLNIKCHDLKHTLKLLKENENKELNSYVKDLEQTVENYDEIVKTGSNALDITISEMRESFKSHKIYFTYFVDGKLLNFLQDTEIYSLFGNILKNALNACLKETDKEKRSISLSVSKKANQIYIHEDNISNYEVVFENGLPKTNQNNAFHGFGTKSIEYVVKKYNGIVNFSNNNNRFCVDILIPINEENKA